MSNDEKLKWDFVHYCGDADKYDYESLIEEYSYLRDNFEIYKAAYDKARAEVIQEIRKDFLLDMRERLSGSIDLYENNLGAHDSWKGGLNMLNSLEEFLTKLSEAKE